MRKKKSFFSGKDFTKKDIVIGIAVLCMAILAGGRILSLEGDLKAEQTATLIAIKRFDILNEQIKRFDSCADRAHATYRKDWDTQCTILGKSDGCLLPASSRVDVSERYLGTIIDCSYIKE